LKITIITVSFNARDALRETFENVSKFSGKYHDYIVIDGGSTDGTLELIEEYRGVVTKWASEKDNGIYDAMNKGWRLADEDSHILYLGAGDTLTALPEVLPSYTGAAVFGTVLLENTRLYRSTADFRLMLGSTVHHQALLVPKSAHVEAPFDTSFRTYADFDFNQRLKKKNVRFVFDEKFLAAALPGGFSSRLKISEMVAVVRKNHGLFLAGLSRAYLALQVLKSSFKANR
jgi:glycosyltransferase involved in cell wall biosynthesis